LADFSNKVYYQNSYRVIVYLIPRILHTTLQITEVLIFYADKLVMGSSKNLHVLNFAILRESRKLRKNLMFAKYTPYDVLQ